MNKKILFITPGLGTGGTNQSLNAIYTNIKDYYDISVFAITHQTRAHQYSFDEVLLPENPTMALLVSKFGNQKGWTLVKTFIYKLLQSLLGVFEVDLKMLIGRRIVKKLEKGEHYDYVVAFMEGFTTHFGTLFHTSNKIAWIHCNYNMHLPLEQSEEHIYKKYAKIVCVSQYTAKVFADRYPTLKDRTHAIHNLVEASRLIEMGNQTINDDRFNGNQFRILSAGRFHQVKRFREIPLIASKLKKTNMRFCWYVLGPVTDITEWQQFEKNIQDYGVDDCVKWLGPKPNPYPYFKASDLYVCTSESEACPMVFIEAKVFGVPIVTTNFPSSYEFIHDSDGQIVPLEDVSDAISRVIDNPQKKKQIVYIDDNTEVLHQLRELFV